MPKEINPEKEAAILKEFDTTVSDMILKQMGGNRFVVMTGASPVMYSNDSLTFKLPKYKGLKINHLIIKLKWDDTYTMIFGRVHGFKYTEIKTISDVYVESLQTIFTEVTGLDTHL